MSIFGFLYLQYRIRLILIHVIWFCALIISKRGIIQSFCVFRDMYGVHFNVSLDTYIYKYVLLIVTLLCYYMTTLETFNVCIIWCCTLILSKRGAAPYIKLVLCTYSVQFEFVLLSDNYKYKYLTVMILYNMINAVSL